MPERLWARSATLTASMKLPELPTHSLTAAPRHPRFTPRFLHLRRVTLRVTYADGSVSAPFTYDAFGLQPPRRRCSSPPTTVATTERAWRCSAPPFALRSPCDARCQAPSPSATRWLALGVSRRPRRAAREQPRGPAPAPPASCSKRSASTCPTTPCLRSARPRSPRPASSASATSSSSRRHRPGEYPRAHRGDGSALERHGRCRGPAARRGAGPQPLGRHRGREDPPVGPPPRGARLRMVALRVSSRRPRVVLVVKRSAWRSDVEERHDQRLSELINEATRPSRRSWRRTKRTSTPCARSPPRSPPWAPRLSPRCAPATASTRPASTSVRDRRRRRHHARRLALRRGRPRARRQQRARPLRRLLLRCSQRRGCRRHPRRRARRAPPRGLDPMRVTVDESPPSPAACSTMAPFLPQVPGRHLALHPAPARAGGTAEVEPAASDWTAAGSTAAQRSAGGHVLPLTSRQLQLVVREPYTPHWRKLPAQARPYSGPPRPWLSEARCIMCASSSMAPTRPSTSATATCSSLPTPPSRSPVSASRPVASGASVAPAPRQMPGLAGA